MLHPNKLLPLTLVLFAAVACQQAASIEDEPATNAAAAPAASAATTNTAAAPTGAPSAGTPPPASDAQAAIPAGLQGRWGMVPADCEAGRSDAKGLVTIEEKTLRFYESVAILEKARSASPTHFDGDFALSGEGERWTEQMIFDRSGDTLTRTVISPKLKVTYQRC